MRTVEGLSERSLLGDLKPGRLTKEDLDRSPTTS